MSPTPSGTRELRVMTYNVRGLRDDRAAVQRVVGVARPDVVCFQEVPSRVGWRQRCSALARDCDLLYVAGGRPAAGNMLAVSPRIDVYGTADALLSKTDGLTRRGVSTALIGTGGVRLGVVGIHGGLSAAERTRHADEVLAAVDRLTGAGGAHALVAGDLNSPPTRPEWRRLAERMSDAHSLVSDTAAPTYPAAAPEHRIDVVFVTREVEVVSVDVLDSPDALGASDHRPVLAVLRLPADT